MSTGAGGSYEIGGGGREVSPSSAACDQLTFIAALSTPDETVLAKVKVGWILRVETRPAPVSGARVAVVVWDGHVLGSILTPEAPQLADCLEDGHNFYAKVTEIKGGLCRVRIRHS